MVPLGHLGVQAICARVVHRLAAEAALGRYSNIADGPGFARALARVVTELRLAKLGPDALRSVAPDLLPLFEAYESNLAEDGFTDWAGVLTIATDAVMSDGFTHRLIDLPTILLDVPVTSEAELGFVRALSPRIPELLFLAPAADERTLARASGGASGGGRRSRPDSNYCPASKRTCGGSLARLQRHLFKESSNPAEPADDDQVVDLLGSGRGARMR